MAFVLPCVDPREISGEEVFGPSPCVSINLQRYDRQGWQETGKPENRVVIPQLGQVEVRWVKGCAPGRVFPGDGIVGMNPESRARVVHGHVCAAGN